MHTATVKFLTAATRPEQFPDLDLPEIAFAGRSNVGKSSLINTLVGRRQVARVSSTPGRTQSINFFQVNRDWVFVDLPGYGFAKVPKQVRASWQHLVESYLVGRVALQSVVLIIDIRRDPMPADVQLKAFLDAHRIPYMVVATKADKLSRQQLDRQISKFIRATGVPVGAIFPFSAVSHLGRQTVWEAIRLVMERGAVKMKQVRIQRQEDNRLRKAARRQD